MQLPAIRVLRAADFEASPRTFSAPEPPRPQDLAASLLAAAVRFERAVPQIRRQLQRDLRRLQQDAAEDMEMAQRGAAEARAWASELLQAARASE